MTPLQGAAILVIPSVVTNTWQLLAGPSFLHVFKRMWILLAFISAGIWLGFGLMSPGNADFATTALGTVLVIYALLGIFRIQFSVKREMEKWLSPVIGVVSGLVAAATGIFTVPGVMYVQSMDFSREDLIQALGLMFSISTSRSPLICIEMARCSCLFYRSHCWRSPRRGLAWPPALGCGGASRRRRFASFSSGGCCCSARISP
jgi:uncharacterized membrane protein YfcA